MLRTHLTLSTVAGFTFSFVAFAAVDTNECVELKDSKPAELVAYLQADRSGLKPECIAYAADKIGLYRYAPGVQILIQYIDYRLPVDPRKARSPAVGRAPTLGTIYPATDALLEIGKPAIPSLVQVVAARASSDTARTNAAFVLFEIHGLKVADAVRVLVQASHQAEDRETKFRLFEAARKVADMCKGESQNSCINALEQK